MHSLRNDLAFIGVWFFSFMPVLPARRHALQTKRQMAAKIAKRPQGSIWRQVHNTPGIKTVEMGYITRRNRPGVLIPSAHIRRRSTVVFSPRIRAHSEIHTHILRPDTGSIPSVSDLHDFLRDVLRTKIRKWRIISVTSNGIPAGVFHIRAGSKLAPQEKLKAMRNEMNRYLRKYEDGRHTNANEKDELADFLYTRFLSLGFEIRSRSRPNYRFNGFRFVRK